MPANEPSTKATDRARCVDCGSELPPGLPRGLCSRCALAGALELAGDSAPDAPAESQSRLPFRFGDYEIIEEIARGGMGVVYKARQVSLGRLVAVKMLLFGPHASASFIKRFRMEASAAAALLHPNIVAIHEVGVHEGEQFLVMDYIGGPNLAKLVQREPLPPERAARYVKTVAEAIHCAHEKGILHRDLKPSNVLIDPNDQPRVTDFGLAKRLDTGTETSTELEPLTVTGHLLGSPSYMAPEQARGARGKTGRRSDVYSLGATLYHLLTGRPPFGGGSLTDTLFQVQHQEPVSLRLLHPGVPLDLETICLKCLEKEPQRRYPSAKALGEDLQRWLDHEPIQARRISLISRFGRWTRRNPVGATLIATLLFGLVVSLGLLRMLASEKKAAEEAQARTERARSLVLELFGVSGFWDKSTPAIQIPSRILALASGAPVVPADSQPIDRRTLGLLVEEDPAATVVGYAALLASIEKSINGRRTKPVHFEMTLFKKNQDAINALVNHQVDLLKIGGNSYLKAKDRDPRVHLLVSQNPPKQGVIFVRESSELRSVQDLANRSVVFGDRFSTISTWAYYHLIQAGVTNLKHMEFLDSIAVFESDPALRLQPGSLSSHLLTIQAVQTNGYDAGVASESAFLRSGSGLRAILVFPSDPVWWVARGEFPPELEADLKRALVDLRDETIFRGISKRITHYLPANEEELGRLRQAQAVAARSIGEQDETQE